MNRILTFIVVIVATSLSLDAKADESQFSSDEIAAKLDAAEPSLVLGDLKAVHTLAVFQDIRCGMCGRFFRENLNRLRESRVSTGDMKIEIFEFPLGMRQDSAFLARAALCAGEQDKYLLFLAGLYHREGVLDSSPRAIMSFAESAGIDSKALMACLVSGRYVDKVDNHYSLGVSVGVSGTPTLFYDGRDLGGYRAYDHFLEGLKATE